MILTEEGKKDFLKTKFHQYFDITLSSDISIKETNIEQFVNFVLPLETLNEEYDMSSFKKYLNDDYNNVIFTPANDSTIIYNYEFYQGVYFIRLKPYSKYIRMHIVPKKYDASNTKTYPILFFKDNKQNIDDSIFTCSDEYYREDEHPINLHYQEESIKNTNGMYKFNIKQYTQNMQNLQINLGYSYISPTDSINKIWHITGIIDESDEDGNTIPHSEFTEFNSTLCDGNCDNNADFTNKILEQKIKNNEIDWGDLHKHDGGFNNSHNINQLYHKTLKYFNDDLYIEENGNHHLVDWIEIKEE